MELKDGWATLIEIYWWFLPKMNKKKWKLTSFRQQIIPKDLNHKLLKTNSE